MRTKASVCLLPGVILVGWASGLHAQTSDSAEGTAPSGAGEQRSAAVGEVTVTAQKRGEELLQDVPIPVTVLDAAQLISGNETRIEDYFTRIPGLSYNPGLWGDTRIIIRGLGLDPNTNPTVGVLVDDVPYTASTYQGGGFTAPDIDPNDLARVEVLRGPQGTLYGTSSLGGLLKFVTVDPSTERFSGHMQAGATNVHNGDGLGYSVRAGANLPVNDTLAVRLSGFTREDAGWIDDPARGISGVNGGDAQGGRLAMLWRPSEALNVKLSGLIQDSNVFGGSSVDTQLQGDLQQISLPDTGTFERHIEAYSSDLRLDIGLFELVSLSGYNIDRHTAVGDLGVLIIPDDFDSKKVSQEVQLNGPIASFADMQFGLFYTRESATHLQDYYNVDDAGAMDERILQWDIPSKFREAAVFTNFLLKFTEKFDLQLGGRYSDISQSLGTEVTEGGAVISDIRVTSEASPFTYLLAPRFRFAPDAMVYARIASGYRTGGPNTNAELIAGLGPPAFAPDKTKNYEIGVKADVFDKLLSIDVSVYHIDWDNIQLGLFTLDGFFYTANAGGARSRGIETSIELRPAQGMAISAWVTRTDAELTGGLPAETRLASNPGDRLPGSSKTSGHLSFSHEFAVAADLSILYEVSASYVGERAGTFPFGQRPRHTMPSYTTLDLRIGSAYQEWSADLFVNNATDKRGILSREVGFYAGRVNYIKPREIGVSIARRF